MVLGIRILALMLARRLLYPPNHTHNPYVAFTLFYFLWVASVYARELVYICDCNIDSIFSSVYINGGSSNTILRQIRGPSEREEEQNQNKQ